MLFQPRNSIYIILLIIASMVLRLHSYAQNPRVDSLQKAISECITDSIRVDLMNELAEFYRNEIQDSSIYYAELALDLAIRSEYLIGESKALSHLGNVYFDKGEYKKAKSFWDSALAINLRINHQVGIATNTLNIAHLYNFFYKLDIDTCRILYYQALNRFDSLNNKRGMASTYNGLAASYYYDTDYVPALELYTKALNLFLEIKDTNGIGNTYNNIGLIHLEQGIYSVALDYFHKALTHYETVNNDTQLANVYSSISFMHLEMEDYNSAEKYLKKAREYFEQLQNPLYLSMLYDNFSALYEKQFNDSLAIYYSKLAYQNDLRAGNEYYICHSYINLAGLYYNFEQYDTAFVYYKKCIDLAQKLKNDGLLSNGLLGLATVYNHQGNLTKAIEFGEKAWEIAKNIDEKQRIMSTASLLSDIYAKTSNYHKAYEFHNIFKQSSDSLLNIENIRAITGKEYEYEYTRRQQEQELLQQQNQKLNEAKFQRERTIRNFILILTLVLIFLFIMVYRSYHRKQKANKLLQEKNDVIYNQNKQLKDHKKTLEQQTEELKQINHQLKALAEFKEGVTHMIIHDLKNPLNTIINTNNKDDKTLSSIKQAGKHMLNLVLNMLDISKHEEKKLKINCQKHNIYDTITDSVNQIEFLLQEKQLSLNTKIPTNIQLKYDEDIIQRVLINLLTNAIKYSPVNGKIEIISEVRRDRLFIEIIDQGSGIPEEFRSLIFEKFGQVIARKSGATRSSGLGLAFSKLAIEAHKGEINYESNHKEGTKFWFALPIIDTNLEPVIEKSEIKETKSSIPRLSDECKTKIKPYIERLKSLETYEISEIKKVINSIPIDNNPIVQEWKEKLFESVMADNEEEYYKLLNI